MFTEWIETEGPTGYLLSKNVDLRKPPPRLVWGTGEHFARHDEKVVRFIEESLGLPFYEDWNIQRAAYRRLVGWFFAERGGPAWISTVSYKPESASILRNLSVDTDDPRWLGRFEHCQSQLPPEEYGMADVDGNVKGVQVDWLDMTPRLPLKGFVFAYGREDKIAKDVRLYRQARESRLFASGKVCRASGVVISLGNPGDQEIMLKDGGATVSRDFIDHSKGIYLCPHIRFCSLPRWPGRLEDARDYITYLVIALRPDDGRTCHFVKGRRRAAMYLQQQELDYQMLGSVGVVHG